MTMQRKRSDSNLSVASNDSNDSNAYSVSGGNSSPGGSSDGGRSKSGDTASLITSVTSNVNVEVSDASVKHAYARAGVRVASRGTTSSVPRPSLLSAEASSNSYRGFLNLGMLLMFFSNARLIITNLQKYGLLVTFQFSLNAPDSFLFFLLASSYVCWIALSLLIERYAKFTFTTPKRKHNENLITAVQSILLISMLVWPCFWTLRIKPSPVISVCNMITVVIVFMKLYSYFAVNKKERLNFKARQNEDKTLANLVQYPRNLTVKNISYFMVAPTLVYELNFPRTPKIRWGWLANRVVEFILVVVLITIIVEQYLTPLIRNAMKPLDSLDLINISERIFKMAVPYLLMWLMGFYAFFHLWLNILGEITCFGDRLFYLDWWNSTTLEFFWRSWNLPVHRWLLAHVYSPLLERKVSRPWAVFWVFFVSSFFHEFLVSIPFLNLKFWAFGAMMIQMPLCSLTAKYTKGKQIGNVILWLSLMFGQINAVLLYYYHYQKGEQNLNFL